jgi:hypothetical protein
MMGAPGNDMQRAYARESVNLWTFKYLPWLIAACIWAAFFLIVAIMPGDW